MMCGHLEKDPIFGRISTLRPFFRHTKKSEKKFKEKMACHQNIPPRRNSSNF